MKNFHSRKKAIFIFIIAIALIVIGLVIYFFAPISISGDWELVVNPEITSNELDDMDNSGRVFYSISKAGKYGDGTYKTYYEGGVEKGRYKLSEKEGKNYINLGTGDFEYKITRSKLFGKAKLTIIYPEQIDNETGKIYSAQNYVFVQAKAPKYESESYSKFKTDKRLLSEWISDQRSLSYYTEDLSYKETIKFNDKGIMTIHYESEDLALDRYMYYAYTIDDDTITFSLVTDKKTKYSVSYGFDADGNLQITEDSTTSSIFADEIFSNITFYSPDNFQENNENNLSDE